MEMLKKADWQTKQMVMASLDEAIVQLMGFIRPDLPMEEVEELPIALKLMKHAHAVLSSAKHTQAGVGGFMELGADDYASEAALFRRRVAREREREQA